MSHLSTPAIILRRIDYGDYDLILSLMTLHGGKISAIAKTAKKSRKRFGGILEPFSVLDVVIDSQTGKRRLPMLNEATLARPFPGIRSDFIKAAYASYWAELIHEWMAENYRGEDVFDLFCHVLEGLDSDRSAPEALSIIFQIRFIALAGYMPNLTQCVICKRGIDDLQNGRIVIDIRRGGAVCRGCRPQTGGRITLSKSSIKQLRWIESGDLAKTNRIRFDKPAIKEGLAFLEVFVPYHLGKEPRSLAFLRSIRTANDRLT